MRSDNEKLEAALDAYFGGDATSIQIEIVHRWVAEQPQGDEALALLRDAWQATGHVRVRDLDAKRAKFMESRVHRHAAEAGTAAGQIASGRSTFHGLSGDRPNLLLARRERHGALRPMYRIGMSLAAAAVVAIIGYSFSSVRHGTHEVAAPPAMRDVSTVKGQRATIELRDGSRIILGSTSRVRYAQEFGTSGSRDIYLDGEAYFEVAHDTLHPFRVHTTRGIAEDLGTKFVVTVYPETRGMQVFVESGSVALRHDTTSSGIQRTNPALVLTGGELGRLDSGGVATRLPVRDSSQYMGLVTGQLVFRGVPLRQALPMINRWYDLDIVLGDSTLGSEQLVAEFHQQSAAEVMRLLAMSVDARYEHRGHEVVLLPRTGMPRAR
jgi:ferric-dicitrate binding protein FerR (iron transport regulator)